MVDLSEYEELPDPFAGAPTFRDRMPEVGQVVHVERCKGLYIFRCTILDGDAMLSGPDGEMPGLVARPFGSSMRWIPAKRKDGAS